MIEIVDWDKYYENNRTRELKQMQWVPMPNHHDGDGYTALLDHPNGTAHFGAWCALIQVASRCGNPAGGCGNTAGRGILMRKGGEAHDPASLARITRIPETIWLEVLPRLVNIGWIKGYEIPQEGAGSSAESRTQVRPSRAQGEWNGMERKNGKKRRIESPAADAAIVKTDPLYHGIERGFLQHNGGKFTDYGKEGKAIQGLIEKARARDKDNAKDLLVSVCAAFWKLKQGTDKFWQGQPFLPSALNASSIWDRVLESMRREEIPPDVLAIIEGGKT
jgi:hypothetical protein